MGSSVAIFWPGSLIFGFPGVMGPYWRELFGVGRGPIGNILFFVLAAVGIFMFLVGRWQEKVGPKGMMTTGAVICGLDLLLLVLTKALYVLYLWAFLMGAASCFIYIPALTVVQRWFPSRRGLVSGIVNMVFGLSAAIMSPIFGWMLRSLGYAAMNLLLAFLALAVGVIASRLVEVPEGVVLPRGVPTRMRSLTLKESLRTRSFWFLWATWALQGAAGIAMVTLSTAFGISRGFSMAGAVLILTAFNMTNGLSRLLAGYLSDIVGRNSTMSATFFAAAAAYFLLPHVASLALSAVLAAIIGFAFGTLFAVSAPLVSDCFGLEHFGVIFGLIFTAYGFVSGAIGPSLSGYILDATGGDFTLVLSYLGLFSTASGLLIRFVTPPEVPTVATKKNGMEEYNPRR